MTVMDRSILFGTHPPGRVEFPGGKEGFFPLRVVKGHNTVSGISGKLLKLLFDGKLEYLYERTLVIAIKILSSLKLLLNKSDYPSFPVP